MIDFRKLIYPSLYILLMALCPLLRAQVEPADLVLLHGKIWTGEPFFASGRNNPPANFVEAIAVRQGRIVAVGASNEIRKFVGSNTRTVDLQGRMTMPGFVDDHVHFLTGGFQLVQISLRDARDEAEFVRLIELKAKELGPGRWIEGGRWNFAKWPSRKLPTRWLIDPVTRDNPAFLNSWDGHQILANTLALKLAGVTSETPDPPGGHIERDPGTGQPTGILKDTAMQLVAGVMPKRTPEEIEAALRRGLAEARRFGVTSVADMNLGERSPSGGINYARTSVGDELRLLRRAQQEGWLTCRFYEVIPYPNWDWLARLGITHNVGDEWVQLGAVKAFADGSIESSSAWMYEPYDDRPDTQGLPNAIMVPRKKAEDLFREITAAGIQVMTHAIGDKAIAEMLNVLERVVTDPAQQRIRLEHNEVVRPEDFRRFGEIGVIASMQPVIDGGAGVEARIGRVRAHTSYAWRSMLDSGAVLAFGSDWPVVTLNPLVGIHSAVTRQDANANPPSGWIPEQRITLEEALRAYTAASAYAAFQETEKGSIAVGKLADIVVLSDDLFSIAPQKIKDVRVMTTIVGGQIVYEAKTSGD